MKQRIGSNKQFITNQKIDNIGGRGISPYEAKQVTKSRSKKTRVETPNRMIAKTIPKIQRPGIII